MRIAFLPLAALVALGALAVSPDARANGRFPESNHIFFSPAEADLVLLRTTFGLLVSHDRGKTWSWVCERSIGSAGVEDPMWALTPNGSYVATTFQGLTISHDRACSFSFAGGPLANTVFVDLAQNPADQKDVVILASSYDKQDDAGNILFKSEVFETKDEAQTFASLSSAFDPALLAETVDLSATDPNRIYVSAVRNPSSTPPVGVLMASKDHGANWASYDIPLVDTERAIFIAGVDPKNADRVYVRTSNGTDKPSRLLVSDDGAKTYLNVFTSKSALTGFALSPDGSKIYVGSALDGVQVASTTDFQFQQRALIEVQCLAFGADGLWACSSEKSGFVAGLSTDDGATFQPKLHFCDILGPLACPADTVTNIMCGQAWPAQADLLGCPAAPDGGSTSSSSSGATPDGGTGDGGGGSGSGCACHVGPPAPLGALAAAAGALLAFARRRRRRR